MNCSEINDLIVAVGIGLLVLCFLIMVFCAGVMTGTANVQEEITKRKELE